MRAPGKAPPGTSLFPAGRWHLISVLLLSCALLSLASCSSTRQAARQPLELPVMTVVSDSVAYPAEWWRSFNDPELDRLVTTALTNNFSIQKAGARLRQAAALVKQAGSGRWPSVALSAEAASQKARASEDGTTTDSDSESYQLGVSASYELDLWGRVDAEGRAAEYAALSTESELYAAAMTVSAETALRYFQLMAKRQSLGILDDQLATARHRLALLEHRFNRSQANAVDVLQQKGVVLATEALAIAAAAEERVLVESLAVLAGFQPGTQPEVTTGVLPAAPVFPEPGIPADLLARRPDIRSAWFDLLESDADVQESVADRLPSVKLSVDGVFSASSLSLLFDNWILQLAASLSQSLRDGGNKRAEVERRRAVSDEKLAGYRETVANAVRETLEAIHMEDAARRKLDTMTLELETARQAREQAFQRYAGGSESYLRVLDAVAREETLARNLVEAEYQRLAWSVSLFRATGCDWHGFMNAIAPHRAAESEEDTEQ